MGYFKFAIVGAITAFLPILGAQEIHISTPKSHLVRNEPAFVNLSMLTKRFRPQAVFFNIEGPHSFTNAVPIGGGNRILRQKRDLSAVNAAYSLWGEENFFFSTPGKYRVSAFESTTKRHSNVLVFDVEEVPEPETAAFRLFTEVKPNTFLDDSRPTGVLDPYRELITRFPNAILAPYANYALLYSEFKTVEKRGIQASEMVELNPNLKPIVPKLAALAKRYSGSEKIPAPSLWHADALFKSAELSTRGGDLAEAKKAIQAFKALYPWDDRVQVLERWLNEIRVAVFGSAAGKKDRE